MNSVLKCLHVYILMTYMHIFIYIYIQYFHICIDTFVIHSTVDWRFGLIFLGIHELIPAFVNFGVTIGFNRFNSKTMRQTGSSKKNIKNLMHHFFPPQKTASQHGVKKNVVFVSKVLEWNNVLAANMPIFTCFLENQA